MTDTDTQRARRRARNSHALAQCNGMGRTAGSILWQPLVRKDGKYFMPEGAELSEPPVEFRSERLDTILDEMDAVEAVAPTPVIQPFEEWKAQVDAAMAVQTAAHYAKQKPAVIIPNAAYTLDDDGNKHPADLIVSAPLPPKVGRTLTRAEYEALPAGIRAIRASGAAEPFGPIPADHPDLVSLAELEKAIVDPMFAEVPEPFRQYRRSQIAELRPYLPGEELAWRNMPNDYVSISQEDIKAGSPRVGDMIARNPKNHKDQWLVAEQYFKDNFEPIE